MELGSMRLLIFFLCFARCCLGFLLCLRPALATRGTQFVLVRGQVGISILAFSRAAWEGNDGAVLLRCCVFVLFSFSVRLFGLFMMHGQHRCHARFRNQG
jgi:hypothetical protein